MDEAAALPVQLAQMLLIALPEDQDGRALVAFAGFGEMDGIVERLGRDLSPSAAG